jgi:hypothetical protein
MNTFTHKGYGRIYVDKSENIDKVKAIIKQMSEYEYGYMPDKLINTFSEYPQVTYIHKFSDLDIDALTALCWQSGLFIWAFDSGHTEYPVSALS